MGIVPRIAAPEVVSWIFASTALFLLASGAIEDDARLRLRNANAPVSTENTMIDVIMVSQRLVQDDQQSLLRVQDAVARAHAVLGKTASLAAETYRLMGPGSSRRAWRPVKVRAVARKLIRKTALLDDRRFCPIMVDYRAFKMKRKLLNLLFKIQARLEKRPRV